MVDISKIDMDRINGLIEKLESMKYVVESWQEGNNWYRVWNDGWIEQGGIYLIKSGTITSNQTKIGYINFIKPFTLHSDNIICNPSSWAGNVLIQIHNPTGCKESGALYGRSFAGTVNADIHCAWTAFGY